MVEIEKRVTDLELQSRRFISHLKSEQRVYNQHGERLTEQAITLKVMSESIKEIKDEIKSIDKTLRNGNGLTIRVDRLEQQQKVNMERMEDQQAANNNRTDRWIAVCAILISLLSVLIQIIKP